LFQLGIRLRTEKCPNILHKKEKYGIIKKKVGGELG